MTDQQTPEQRWIEDTESACPYCGGSGHKDDIRADLAAPQWQPIEDAPTDGSDFLGRFDNGEIIMCYYLDNSDTRWPWSGFRPRHGAETPGRTLIECIPLSALEGSAS